MKKKDQSVLLNVIFIGTLLAFVIYSFFAFMRDNNRRIIEQNNSFIKSATEKTSARISDLIDMSLNDVSMIAQFYGSTMTEPEVTPSMLRDMVEMSSFDYVEFVSEDGIDMTAEGQTADVSDMDYFQQGMKGNSGKCVVYNSRITNETLLIFYSPFYYENRIIGVLCGILNGDTIYEVLSADYFDVQANSYLLERNGSVILSAGDSQAPENLLEALKTSDILTPEDLQKFETALNEGGSANFNFQGTSASGSAYITTLRGKEWVLVQNFPSSVTKSMVSMADSAGVALEVRLIIAFIVYIIYLVVRSQIQKRRLVSEKQEISRIVGAVTQLFTRFALVDFEKDTYEYLEDKKSSASVKGRYSDLVKFLGTKYVDDGTDENSVSMRTVITKAYVQEHLTPDVPYLQFEYQIDMDGRHWENISILCMRRKDGLPSDVLFAIQDVTALKEQEEQIRMALRAASDAAEAANRAKSDFLARMSHDIRTPMNAIMGMTAVATMHLDDKERLTDCLNKITISSRHLLALINDVLDMSKIESGKVTLSEEPFNMADMVESIVTIIRSQATSRHQRLKVHISDIEHENVIGDTLRLRQIFVNILGNAVKFTPEGGTIIFSIRECRSLIHGMACYEFVSEDTGIGMDEDFIKTIFDPFARSQNSVSRNIEGTGLGMSITRNIVQMMEGDIKVESKLGEGSRFTVQLHLKLQDQTDESVEALANMHVLVADDDEDSCVSTCEILKDIGVTAEWVTDGDQAIAATIAAHQTQRDYSAVILDWKMPGRDGIETAREIRRQIGDEVPIIILSAYDWTEAETTAREAGVQAFIEKPLFRSRLIFALKSVLLEETSEKSVESAASESSKYSGRRILLVEDNELNREIAVELLSYIDVIVEEAENGQEALTMVQEHPMYYYDLIFMDIQMPVMNGYEAARAIRALGREDTDRIPIIAMTANAFADDIRDAFESGMNDHVAKPVEVAKLTEALDKWLAK